MNNSNKAKRRNTAIKNKERKMLAAALKCFILNYLDLCSISLDLMELYDFTYSSSSFPI